MSLSQPTRPTAATDVHFEEATPADDAGIRHLLRRTPMPGSVTVAFEREPSFFRSLEPMGSNTQVVVGRPRDNPDRIVALGCRTLRDAFVDGEPQRVEYLHQMRVDPDYRGQGLVEKGFRTIRTWHEADPVPYSYATITAENPAARTRLVNDETGAIPAFRPLVDLHTLTLILRRWRVRSPSTPDDVTVTCTPDDPATIAGFLREVGRDRPFFPVYRAEDLAPDAPTGVAPKDVFVARRNGQMVGALALRDVSEYKQTVVRGYRGALQWTRPLVNAGLRLAGARRLPEPGESLRSLYASMVCYAPGHEDVYAGLLEAAYGRALDRDAAYLIVGGAEGDSLLTAARRYLHIPYRSTLYTVHWTDAQRQPSIDARPPAVDVATL